MSGRHSQPRANAGQDGPSGRRAALVAGGGLAGLVSIVAVTAPLMDVGPAGAAEATAAAIQTASAPQTSTSTTQTSSTSVPVTSTTEAPTSEPVTSTSEPVTSTTTTTTTEAPTSEPVTSTTTTEPLTPDYGFQKYRVGVRPKEGSYVPAGITTAGSLLHVTESDSDGGTVDQFDCTTTADVTANGTTYCDPSARDENGPQQRAAARRAHDDRAAHPAVVTGPPDTIFDNTNVYYATTAGTSITVTQTSAPDGLVADPQRAELPPCEPAFAGDECAQTDVIFEDTGLPPKANDDSATTAMNTPVTIDVGANDSTYFGSKATYDAPVTEETIAAEPHDGTVQVAPLTGGSDTGRAAARVAAAAVPAPPKITYTPRTGFHGVDRFQYTLRTRNGASTATVTVTVPGATSPATTAGVDPTSETRTSFAVDPTSETRSPAAVTSSSGGLASTGTPTSPLLGYGAALVVAGAGAVAVGRHRRPRTGRRGRTH